MKSVVIKYTRMQAKELGLLVCECGWPENNHFSFGKKVCAHNPTCKGYKEKAKIGKLIKESK